MSPSRSRGQNPWREREHHDHLHHDASPPTVEVPQDLDAALTGAGVRERFDALAYSARKEHLRSVQDAKQAETGQRRVTKIIEKLGG